MPRSILAFFSRFGRLAILFWVTALAGCATPQQKMGEAAALGEPTRLASLLKDNSDPNAVFLNAAGKCAGPATALLAAACNGHTQAVGLLLKAGADPNAAGEAGTRVLMVAANAEIANQLMEGGAKIEAQDAQGRTALIRAAAENRKDVVEALLKRGADVTITDGTSRTAFNAATAAGAKEAATILGVEQQKLVDSKVAEAERAAAAGNSTKALTDYSAALRLTTGIDGAESALRLKIYRYAAGQAKLWTIPEAARDPLVRSNGGASDEVLKAAIQAAPWWPEGYYATDLAAGIIEASRQASQGDSTATLTVLATTLNKARGNPGPENDLRTKIFRYAGRLSAAPGLPDAAREHLIRVDYLIKNNRSADEIEAELRNVLTVAPWWPDGYFNLGLAQAAAGRYPEARRNLELYLVAAPAGPKGQAVRDKLIELKIIQEEADKIAGLRGQWVGDPGYTYSASLVGEKLQLSSSGRTITVAIKGNALEGGVESQPYAGAENCQIPGQNHPATGTINGDRTVIEIEFPWSTYGTQSHCVDMFGLASNCCLLCSHVCDATPLLSTTTQRLRLTRGH